MTIYQLSSRPTRSFPGYTTQNDVLLRWLKQQPRRLPVSTTPRHGGDRHPSGPWPSPTSDDLEFVGMANGSGDLIFDALCMDLDSNLSLPESDEVQPFGGKENKDSPATAPPFARQVK